jgi:hypothetical protein
LTYLYAAGIFRIDVRMGLSGGRLSRRYGLICAFADDTIGYHMCAFLLAMATGGTCCPLSTCFAVFGVGCARDGGFACLEIGPGPLERYVREIGKVLDRSVRV